LPAFVLKATSYLLVGYPTESAGVCIRAGGECNRRAVQRMSNRGESGGNGGRKKLG